MANRHKFSIDSLYPEDYCFDWEAFEADPEHYVFTADDIAYSNAVELEEYEEETPMTRYEKRALRRWVASGHSVREMPPSKYGCIYPSHPAPDFLEVYRTDKELDAATKGMTAKQKIAYLKEYMGFVDDTDVEQQADGSAGSLDGAHPEKPDEKIRLLRRQLHYIWMYLAQEGSLEEAEEFVKEHMDEPIPFEDVW